MPRSALVVLAHALGVLTTACVVVTAVGSVLQDGASRALVGDLVYAVLLAVTLAVGWLVAARMPRHPVGWILLAIPALWTVGAPLTLLQIAVQHSAPGVAQWISWFNGTNDDPSWSWLPPVWLLLVLLPLRFPTGHLPSPRWRWFSRLTVVALVAASVVIGTGGPTVEPGLSNPAYLPLVHQHLVLVLPVALALLAVSFVVSIASLFVRYHHAAILERAQLRWMLWAVALASAALVAAWALPGGFEANGAVALVLYCAVPVAVAIAVLRYRLYEIDRIISRTAAYAIVTLSVIAVYVGISLLAGLLLPGAKTVGVALATLTAAAVFLPILRRVRAAVDRVFNRQQYDAERVVDTFGRRLRDGADPETTGAELTIAVDRTLQPRVIGIWTPGGPS